MLRMFFEAADLNYLAARLEALVYACEMNTQKVRISRIAWDR